MLENIFLEYFSLLLCNRMQVVRQFGMFHLAVL
jgi:hypothetical protein